MDHDEREAVARIRATFDRAVADGLAPESVTGASDARIDEFARSQGVRSVPAAVREVLRLIGDFPGLWLMGSDLGPGADAKRQAVATLAAAEDPLRDSGGLLVLVAHQAYAYHVIDGADLSRPDPAVWLVTEGEPVTRPWSGVSAWFESVRPDVARYRERLEIMREIGRRREPAWARHIRLD